MILLFFLFFQKNPLNSNQDDCANISLVENGFCNDLTNNKKCNFDGGDCCVNIKTDYCSECTCYLEEMCETGLHPSVGDGICNDETNIDKCNFDEGDCCGNGNKNFCVDCTCFIQDTCNAGFPPPSVGDGFCNDENNYPECQYDGGDCCVNVNKEYCLDCFCYGYGFINSPEYPNLYGNNVNLIWHIQLPLGHYIQIRIEYYIHDK